MRIFVLISIALLLLPLVSPGQDALTRCGDIRSLTREQAAEGKAVVLRGVIISGQRERRGFVLHDGAHGIYVTPGQGEVEWVNTFAPEMGSMVEVRGVTGPGVFAPVVVARRVEYLGAGVLPKARAVTLTELRTGEFDCQRVELRGVVQRVHFDERASQVWLQVAEQGGGFSAVVNSRTALDDSRLVDAEVRVTGTCLSFYNTRGEIVGARMRLAKLEDIEVIQPPLADPFAAPEASTLALRPFRNGPLNLHRQRLSGVVMLARAGEFVYVQTKARCFRVNTRSTDRFTPGDVVEATGFVGPSDRYAAMDDALLRKTGHTSVPPAISVSSAAIFHPRVNQGNELRVEDYDGALVTLRGRLVRVEALADHEPRLYLDCEGSLIRAELGRDVAPDSLAHLRVESEVEATGICVVALDQEWPAAVMPAPASFSLLLRDVNDMRVVLAPSWWTRERVLRLLAGVAVLAAMAGLWAIALRRRVSAQTEIIRLKVERESVLGERERIARELHDTIEQELMGVNMLLEETNTHLPVDTERAAQTLSLAHKMLRHCREESRSSIRDLRSVALENLGLPAALDELLRPVATMNGAAFAVTTEGTPARLTTSIETSILRICHEAVANAAKHSGAASITVTLNYEPSLVTLIVRDDGRGFDPKAPRGPDLHFGLIGMEERADKIGAKLLVDSSPGKGTVVTVILPVP